MQDSLTESSQPTISIILPTYNRAAFLPEAFASIRDQTHTDWELIVVDDGSTDDTRTLVSQLTAAFDQPVRYIYQANQGAYGARNTGLDHATGKYVAFYDSDDIWLSHHLARCVDALDANDALDWVYGACTIKLLSSGEIASPSTFLSDGQPRPFLKLRTHRQGDLHIIDDPRTVRFMILHGLYCGLQNSVIRRRVFATLRFEAASRNEAEDQLIVVRALKQGTRLAYYNQIHVVYRVHADNSSGASLAAGLDQRIRLFELLAARWAEIPKDVDLTVAESRALRRRLSRVYFWQLGYALLWANGRRDEARQMFRRGLQFWPWDISYWKTWLVTICR